MAKNSKTTTPFPRAGFIRRLAAIIYDALVAVAVGMCAGLVFMVVSMILFQQGWIDPQGHEHFMDFFQRSLLFTTLSQIWVALWVSGFFLWFWKNGGQTIGMRAWRLRLFSTSDEPMGYARAVLRLVFSFLGVGTILVLFDPKNKLSLQDRVAKTEVLILTKDANDHKAWQEIQ